MHHEPADRSFHLVEFVANFRWMLHTITHRLKPYAAQHYESLIHQARKLESSLEASMSEAVNLTANKDRDEDEYRIKTMLSLACCGYVHLLTASALLDETPPTMHSFLLRAVGQKSEEGHSQAFFLLLRWLVGAHILSPSDVQKMELHAPHHMMSAPGTPPDVDEYRLAARTLSSSSPFHLWGHLLLSQNLLLHEAVRNANVDRIKRHVALLRRHAGCNALTNLPLPDDKNDQDNIEEALLVWIRTAVRAELEHERRLYGDTGSPVSSPYGRLLVLCCESLQRTDDLYDAIKNGLALCVVVYFYLPEMAPCPYSPEDSGWWQMVVQFVRELNVCTPFSSSEALEYAESALSLHMFVWILSLFTKVAAETEEAMKVFEKTGVANERGGLFRLSPAVRDSPVSVTASPRTLRLNTYLDSMRGPPSPSQKIDVITARVLSAQQTPLPATRDTGEDNGGVDLESSQAAAPPPQIITSQTPLRPMSSRSRRSHSSASKASPAATYTLFTPTGAEQTAHQETPEATPRAKELLIISNESAPTAVLFSEAPRTISEKKSSGLVCSPTSSIKKGDDTSCGGGNQTLSSYVVHNPDPYVTQSKHDNGGVLLPHQASITDVDVVTTSSTLSRSIKRTVGEEAKRLFARPQSTSAAEAAKASFYATPSAATVPAALHSSPRDQLENESARLQELLTLFEEQQKRMERLENQIQAAALHTHRAEPPGSIPAKKDDTGKYTGSVVDRMCAQAGFCDPASTSSLERSSELVPKWKAPKTTNSAEKSSRKTATVDDWVAQGPSATPEKHVASSSSESSPLQRLMDADELASSAVTSNYFKDSLQSSKFSSW